MRILTLALLLLLQRGGEGQLGAITGKVQTANGSPAKNLRVAALSERLGPAESQGSVLAAQIETDANGNYHLERLPPGRYHIMAGPLTPATALAPIITSGPLLSGPTYYPGVKSLRAAHLITVSAGATITGLDFEVREYAPRTVRGRLSGMTSGTPSGMFKATLKPESGPIMQQADVQSDGRFEFNGVIEGDYTMILAPVGPFSSSNIPVIDPLPIAVNGHDVDDLSVRVSPVILGRVVVDDGSALPLQVRDDPSKASALVRIHAEPMIAGEALSARPRADGAFLWPALTGEYQVAATLLPFGYSIKSISYGSVDLSNNVLKIDAKAPLAELRVTLTASPLPGAGGAVVRGRLVFDEQPRPGSILLQRRDSSSAQRVGVAEARADGTFEIRNVPAGVYALDVLPFGARTQFVTVEEGGSSVYLEVHIDDFDGKPYAGATGRVYDRTGKPAANMRVRYEGRNSTGRYETQTNSAGVYSLDGLLPGDYTVSILEEGRSVLAREVILLIALTSTNDFDLRELTLGRPGVQPR